MRQTVDHMRKAPIRDNSRKCAINQKTKYENKVFYKILCDRASDQSAHPLSDQSSLFAYRSLDYCLTTERPAGFLITLRGCAD